MTGSVMGMKIAEMEVMKQAAQQTAKKQSQLVSNNLVYEGKIHEIFHEIFGLSFIGINFFLLLLLGDWI